MRDHLRRGALPQFDKAGSRSRREFLAALSALFGATALPRLGFAAEHGLRLAASWQVGDGYRLGLLGLEGDRLRILADLPMPTRVHGLLREPAGTLLSVARRPGDWLLRWTVEERQGQGRALAWRWIEPGRAFTGHILASDDGATVYTTEIDLETGAGLIGVRDGVTLAKRDEWPSHGLDPHELLWDRKHAGQLIVANGGVPSLPETGRAKHDLDRMDSSLVRIDAASGKVVRQWRLDDRRLSLRHLAWNGDRLGIALQAEHDDADARRSAPVLAILENGRLQTFDAPGMQGYGGSIAAHADGFAVSSPRAQGIALYDAQGYRDFVALADACPLARHAGRLWAGGRAQTLGVGVAPVLASQPEIRLDNHWIAV